MRAFKIDRTKIDETAVFKGRKGEYVDGVMHDNKNGTDQYGNDGFITQDLGKERRAKGEKGPIIGNWRRIGKKAQQQAPATAQDGAAGGEDDVPF